MATNRLARVMAGHFKKATKEPDPYVVYTMDDADCQTWYIAIKGVSGSNGEMEGGEYIFEVKATDKFPHDPPTFKALTENGVYGLGQKCCISIGEYHKDQYKGVLGMRGFCVELCNGLMNHKYLTELGGINLLKSSDTKLKQLARDSIAYNNKNNKRIVGLLRESYKIYSAAWSISPRIARDGDNRSDMAKIPISERPLYNFREIRFDNVRFDTDPVNSIEDAADADDEISEGTAEAIAAVEALKVSDSTDNSTDIPVDAN